MSGASAELLAALAALEREAQAQVGAAIGSEALRTLRTEYLGRKAGRLTTILKVLPTLDPEARKEVGQRANAAKALIEQLRRPSAERTWEGKVAKVVPYDFRPPTPARIKKALWAPEEAFITPNSFGVGWSVNLGRIVYEVKKHAPGSGGADAPSDEG